MSDEVSPAHSHRPYPPFSSAFAVLSDSHCSVDTNCLCLQHKTRSTTTSPIRLQRNVFPAGRYDEVFQALIDLQIPLPDSGVTQLCHELDRNGDGNITYKELKRCEQSYVAHSREIRKSEIAQQKNHPSRRYSITSGRKH